MKRKKRVFILVGFCLLLMITGTVNILLNNYALEKSLDVSGDTIIVGNFFTNFRQDRVDTRAEQKVLLNAIIASANSSTNAKQTAEAQIDAMLKEERMETTIEGLISAKGFEDVVISILNNNISVLVKSEVLQRNEVAQIVDVVQSQTGLDIDNIKVIPVKS